LSFSSFIAPSAGGALPLQFKYVRASNDVRYTLEILDQHGGSFLQFTLDNIQTRIYLNRRERLVHQIRNLRFQEISIREQLCQHVAFAEAPDRTMVVDDRNLGHTGLVHLCQRVSDSFAWHSRHQLTRRSRIFCFSYEAGSYALGLKQQ